MFDAKSILEGLVRGAAPGARSSAQSGGGLADILGQVLGGADAQRGATRGGRQDNLGQDNPGQDGQGGGFADILAELQKQLGSGTSGGASRNATGASAPAGDAGGGLGDLLNQIKDRIGQPGAAGQGGGGIMDVLGQVLGQATQGAKDGATRIGDATGARDAVGRSTGQTPEEMLARLKELIQQNPLIAGGLGGLVLGTQTGRSIAGSAAKIGALALIGGLAYKAYQNYQSGKPFITGAAEPETAPQGSGFEPAAVTNESAALYVRAMIAAAAADGRIDDGEQARVIASLKQAGVDAEAEEFLANELNRPATIAELAAAAHSPAEALQVYTAARIAIDPDESSEKRFLTDLAQALNIDAKLAAHIDASTRSAAA